MNNTAMPAGFDPRAPAKRGAKLIELIVVLVLFLTGVVWLIGAYPNRDPLWFRPGVSGQPTVIRVYHYGETVEVRRGDPRYAELVSAINETIASHTGYYESLYPHGDSLEHYQTKGYAIELEYAEPVLIHTRQYFPPAKRLMIAIDGSFNYVKQVMLFRGGPSGYLPGGLVLEPASVEALRAKVEGLLEEQTAK